MGRGKGGSDDHGFVITPRTFIDETLECPLCGHYGARPAPGLREQIEEPGRWDPYVCEECGGPFIRRYLGRQLVGAHTARGHISFE